MVTAEYGVADGAGEGEASDDGADAPTTVTTTSELHYEVSVRALLPDGDLIFESGPVKQPLVCEAGGGACDPVVLLDIYFDRPGLSCGSSAFEVEVSFKRASALPVGQSVGWSVSRSEAACAHFHATQLRRQ